MIFTTFIEPAKIPPKSKGATHFDPFSILFSEFLIVLQITEYT